MGAQLTVILAWCQVAATILKYIQGGTNMISQEMILQSVLQYGEQNQWERNSPKVNVGHRGRLVSVVGMAG